MSNKNQNRKEQSLKDFALSRGDVKKEESKLKRWLAKRSTLQQAGIISVFLASSLYLFIQLFTLASAPAVWFFLLLLLINIISAMWLLAKIGLAVAILVLLGVLMRYGWVMLIVYIYITAIVWVYFSTRPTPIDFMITKGVQGAMAMTFYQTLWVLVMAPIVSYVGIPYILSNLVNFYMFASVVYVILMVIFLPIIAKDPIPGAIANGMIMLAVEYAQVILIGPQFFSYLMSI